MKLEKDQIEEGFSDAMAKTTALVVKRKVIQNILKNFYNLFQFLCTSNKLIFNGNYQIKPQKSNHYL